MPANSNRRLNAPKLNTPGLSAPQLKLNRWLGRLAQHQRLLVQFLLLAVTLAATNVLAHAIATSLFLTKAGADSLPFFYMLLGGLSIPVSIAFSQIIDHYPRVRLFRWIMLAALLLVCGLRVLLALNTLPVYYSLYISISLIDLLAQVLLWTMVSDYFTRMEQERHTPTLTMATTTGGLLGGVLVRLLTDHITTENLLLGLPLLYGLAIAQSFMLEHSEKPLEMHYTRNTEAQVLTSLKSFPRLLARYPLIPVLAASTVLSVQLWGLSELQFFSIYSKTFPNQDDLTGFLGLLSALAGVLELGITCFITRPLIEKWGVSRMNLVYPATTLISFVGLALNFQLPAAIFANINYDTLYSSIAQPIHNLNYSALPQRFAGRVRVILDGLLYPTCQAITGSLLLFQQAILTPFQMALSGVILSGLFLGIGYLMSKSYLQAMLLRLRSGSLNFDDIRNSLIQLPDHYVAEVNQLLISEDPTAQILGLDLGSRLPNASRFLTDVQNLLLKANPDVHQAAVKFLITGNHPDFHRYLRTQLVSDSAAVRAAVLEALIATQQSLSSNQLCFFLDDPSSRVRALACVATWQNSSVDPAVKTAYAQAWQGFNNPAQPELANTSRKTMIQVIRRIGDRQFIPLLEEIRQGAGIMIKREVLNTLAALATRHDTALVALAAEELIHSAPPVRIAALNLLQVIQPEAAMGLVVSSLGDPNPEARQQAITAIAAYGELCLPMVQSYLTSPRPEVVDAAVTVIGKIGTQQAKDILFQYLQPDYQQLARTLPWQEQLTDASACFLPLAIALQDYHNHVIRRIIHVLSSLGYTQRLIGFHRSLYSSDLRLRVNAIENLASLGQQRFVQPLLPLLEYLVRHPTVSDPSQASLPVRPDRSIPVTLLVESLETNNRWIQIGAIIALANAGYEIPTQAITSTDPLIQMVAEHAAKALPDKSLHHASETSQTASKEIILSRLFFLKQVSLLQLLSLDDLLLIDRTLKEQEFLLGETIFQEGSWGEDLYIIYRGNVQILKRIPPSSKHNPDSSTLISGEPQRELAHLGPGQYFGDMALFDNLPRSATAIAQTDCTLLTLDKTAFQTLITQRPDIPVQMCKILSLRLRETNNRLDD